jgi:Trk-type K+ transport system membrane component
MRRALALLLLAIFLLYTGVYVFVYLFRAFRLEEPDGQPTVYIWHGDPMIRAVLVAVLFAIGLLLLVVASLNRATLGGRGSLKIRGDLWEWLVQRGEETNEAPEQIAERALAAYRSRSESPSNSAPV